jgi:hypothetical protein
MAAAPVAALVAKANVAKAVIDAAIVADILAPVAVVKPIMVMPVAPVSGRPERTLIRRLDPCAGHPVIAGWPPGPVSGRPQVAVAGSRGLVVVGQGRRRLGSGVFRLLAVPRIIRALVRRLGVGAVRSGRRSALRGTVRRGRRSARIGRDGGRVVGSRVRGLILYAGLAGVVGSLILTLGASDGKKYYRHGK